MDWRPVRKSLKSLVPQRKNPAPTEPTFYETGDVVQLVRTLPYNSVSPISLYTSSIYIMTLLGHILTGAPAGMRLSYAVCSPRFLVASDL